MSKFYRPALAGLLLGLVVFSIFGGWLSYQAKMITTYEKDYLVAQYLETKYPFIEIITTEIIESDANKNLAVSIAIIDENQVAPPTFFPDLFKYYSRIHPGFYKIALLFGPGGAGYGLIGIYVTCEANIKWVKEQMARDCVLGQFPFPALVLPDEQWPTEVPLLNPWILKLIG